MSHDKPTSALTTTSPATNSKAGSQGNSQGWEREWGREVLGLQGAFGIREEYGKKGGGDKH